MPVYEAGCDACGVYVDYIRAVSDCLQTPNCAQCGGSMAKVIRTAPRGYVAGKFDAFRSTVDGSIISSKRGLAEHNARNNVVSLSDGYSDADMQSGSFGVRKEAVSDKRELADDIGAAIQDLKDGYRPEVRYDEQVG